MIYARIVITRAMMLEPVIDTLRNVIDAKRLDAARIPLKQARKALTRAVARRRWQRLFGRELEALIADIRRGV